MLYAALKTIHLLSIIVWIGGMVFAHFFLRPALTQLDAPQRIRLMHDVLGRFFRTVQVVVMLTLGSGIWMIGRTTRQMVQAGVRSNMPIEWMVMATLGVLMMLIFGHIRFGLYARLSRAVNESAWPAGGATLASIRSWVMANLVLGVLIVLVTLLGAAT